MGPSTGLSIDHLAETTHSTPHRILDLVTERATTQAAMIHTTPTANKATTETTTGIEATSRTRDTSKEI